MFYNVLFTETNNYGNNTALNNRVLIIVTFLKNVFSSKTGFSLLNFV